MRPMAEVERLLIEMLEDMLREVEAERLTEVMDALFDAEDDWQDAGGEA